MKVISGPMTSRLFDCLLLQKGVTETLSSLVIIYLFWSGSLRKCLKE